jgi:hypothetical protein
MQRFWPTGIDIDEIASPLKILLAAKEDWGDMSAGVLTLVLSVWKPSKDYIVISVNASHKASAKAEYIFSVLHRADAPYPALIIPRTETSLNLSKNLDEHSSNSPIKKGIEDLKYIVADMANGKEIEDGTVGYTPTQFRFLLLQEFNSPFIRSAIINLASNVSEYPVSNSDDSSSDDSDELIEE